MEERKIEGAKLGALIEAAQKREPGLTQDSLAAEIGKTQGLIGQWVSGSTRIPDKHLLWLSKRLDFDPIEIRESIIWAVSPLLPESHGRLVKVISRVPPEQAEYYADLLENLISGPKGPQK